jgi:demethylmenaquinone methyltransferase/2-methoxy-6-polyprenyl-1,4-benzoquinol methylase
MDADPARPIPYGASDKRAAVRAMFDHIAPGYDRANRWMTFGFDAGWRRACAEAAKLQAGETALDVGTGTGDLALALARSQPRARVIGLDYATAMLRHAPAKAQAAGIGGVVAWAAADGLQLPFADDSVEAVASAFVLRNFADLPRAIGEMARVLRAGGRLVALEASPGGNPLWRLGVKAHFALVVPLLGRAFTGHAAAYRYLGASVAAFFAPERIAELFRSAGLEALPPVVLAGGTILVHRGRK